MEITKTQTKVLKNERWNTQFWLKKTAILMEQVSNLDVDKKKIVEIAVVENKRNHNKVELQTTGMPYFTAEDIENSRLLSANRSKRVSSDRKEEFTLGTAGDMLLYTPKNNTQPEIIIFEGNSEGLLSEDFIKITSEEHAQAIYGFFNSRWGISLLEKYRVNTGGLWLSVRNLENMTIPLIESDELKELFFEIKEMHKSSFYTEDLLSMRDEFQKKYENSFKTLRAGGRLL